MNPDNTVEHGNAPNIVMLTLFCDDVRHHATLIGDSLHLPDAPSVWEAARHSAHAIWGSARLLELMEIAELLRVIRDNFHISQSLRASHKMPLHQAIEWLLQLSSIPPADIPAWLHEQSSTLQQLFQALSTSEETNVVPVRLESAPAAATVMPAQAHLEPVEAVDLSQIDMGLLDLFLTEVDTHVDTLNEGLLALEADPHSREWLEALMRSAHSIKGGARVVRLDSVVGLAHCMEDCFVAAQKSQLQLNSSHIDTLLQCSDVLTRTAQAGRDKDGVALAHYQVQMKQLEAALQAIQAGDTPTVPPLVASPTPAKPTEKQELVAISSVVSAPQSAQSPLPAPDAVIYTRPRDEVLSSEAEPTPPKQTATTPPSTASDAHQNNNAPASPSPTLEKDRVVRVSAGKIERLMGLTGEVTVSARWLPSFSRSMLQLKRAHLDIAHQLERLQDKLTDKNIDEALHKEVHKIREKNKNTAHYLAERLNHLELFTSTLSTHSDRLYREMIGVRMRPFADGVKGLPRLVRDLSRQLGKQVRFDIIGKNTEVDQDILEKLDAPLNHLIRNALDHGLETPEERLQANKPEVGELRLEAVHRSGMLMISLSDDGRGIDLERLREKVKQKKLVSEALIEQLSEAELIEFLFLPGFSTQHTVTEISGRGVGLDVVHSMVHEVGGVVRAESKSGQGLMFHLELPLTLSVIRTFLVQIAGEPYAFPLARIDRCLRLRPDEIQIIEERQYFRFSENNIALVNIHDVLELDSSPPPNEEMNVVVVSDPFDKLRGNRCNAYGLVVDKFLGEYDLVVRPLDARLGKVPSINAVAVMLDGSPVLIFDVEDLVHAIDKQLGTRRLRKITRPQDAPEGRGKHILVADDSITIREMERKLLEHQGYQVDVAVDGQDAWGALRSSEYDLLVTDIDMPRMDGISLIQRVRGHEGLKHLPVVVVSYKDSEEHRLRGMNAGANYYLTKSSFEDDSFVQAMIDLIGEAR